MDQKMRRLRNLLFLFVLLNGFLSLSAFSGKAVKDIKQNQIRQERVEVKQPKYKQINPNVKHFQLEKKLLIF